ncbi:hypothetical protein TNCV_4900261 [Trichonephila clavipes]|nr:hypothetical protein TNCV_4900261 [Trichonephila clavipes]
MVCRSGTSTLLKFVRNKSLVRQAPSMELHLAYYDYSSTGIGDQNPNQWTRTPKPRALSKAHKRTICFP